MSLAHLLLQFSSLSIVIRQEEEGSIYEQLSSFYDVINSQNYWTWPVELYQTIEDGIQRMFSMTVTFSRKITGDGTYRTWCRITLDGRHTLYDTYVPSIMDTGDWCSTVQECFSCQMGCPDFFPDNIDKAFLRSRQSVIVLHINMEDKLTHLKLEIADCMDILMYLSNRQCRFCDPVEPIRNVIFTKTLGANRVSKKAKVTIDGSLEFSAPQCVSVQYHGEPASLFCNCHK
jgi:hypothetical protein